MTREQALKRAKYLATKQTNNREEKEAIQKEGAALFRKYNMTWKELNNIEIN